MFAVIQHQGDDNVKMAGRVLFYAEFPDRNHVFQQLKVNATVRIAFVLKLFPEELLKKNIENKNENIYALTCHDLSV